MSSAEQTQFLKPLFAAAAQQRLVIFAGSGVSRSAGLPNWRSLLIELCEGSSLLDPARVRKTLETTDSVETFLRIAEVIRDGLGDRELYLLLRRLLQPSGPSPLVDTLWAIPGLRGVVTTNYDRQFLDSARRQGHDPLLITNRSEDLGLALRSTPFLFHLHGHLDEPSGLVLSRSDYRRLIHNAWPVTFLLQTLMAFDTVLFVGCGMSDPDWLLALEGLVANLRGHTSRHYALLVNPKPWDTRYLSELNIAVLPVDSYEAVARTVDLLATRTEHGPSAVR